MAGHSHYKNVKRTKDLEAKKRSLAFSKIAKEITLLVKEKGGDIEKNTALKSVIEKAKELNFPKENIEKAIKKGTGELKGETLESFVFEAYGPGNIALIIQGITDNKNRSIVEIRKILNDNDGKMVDVGAVKWMFQQNKDLQWLPKYEIEVSQEINENYQKLIDSLNENESVQQIFSNIKNK